MKFDAIGYGPCCLEMCLKWTKKEKNDLPDFYV